MLHERCAAFFTETSDDIYHSRRQSRIREIARKFQRSEWGLFRRLQNTSTTCRESRRQLPRGHQQRVIPGNYLRGDADRLAERKTQCVVWHGIYMPENLRGHSAVVFEASGRVGDVVFGLDDGLA